MGIALDVDRFYSVAKDMNNDTFFEKYRMQDFLVSREVTETVTLSDIAQNIDEHVENNEKADK